MRTEKEPQFTISTSALVRIIRYADKHELRGIAWMIQKLSIHQCGGLVYQAIWGIKTALWKRIWGGTQNVATRQDLE